MTHDSFVNLVAEMRMAQNAYFRTGDRADLVWSKRSEARVDREVERYARARLSAARVPLPGQQELPF